MKRLITFILAAVTMASSAFADEGMWLLPLLQQFNAKDMARLGCRLTPEEIYSINNSSLKDAVVIFGRGCTAEVISNEGLLTTNHHCGYSSIQALSSDEHNYLENGYWAMDRSQEIPVPGLTVTFLMEMQDVTRQLKSTEEQLRKVFADSTNAEELVYEALEDSKKELTDKMDEQFPGCRSEITSFYNNNVFYIIVYKVYKDVRFVGAPPASVGKFGGETDNWMWPRHTGDFSMFRIYAGKDNEPADYSPENKPYVPKQSLKISLKGVKEGDYTMIMGYPGRTQRFQTAAQLNSMIADHDISIDVRTLRQNIMWKWMEKSPSIRLKYADKYAGSSNGCKKWIGEKKAVKDLNIIGRQEEKEADFTKWVSKNKKRTARYGTALKDIENSMNRCREDRDVVFLYSEVFSGMEICSAAILFNNLVKRSLRSDTDTVAAMNNALEQLEEFYNDYYEPLDKEMTAAMLEYYRKNAKSDVFPDIPGGDFATMDLQKYTDEMFSGSVFTSLEKVKGALKEGYGRFETDPAYILAKQMQTKARPYFSNYFLDDPAFEEGTKNFAAGLLEWKKGASYPDANFTMRLSYGTVKSYSPRDAVNYNYYTTIYGVIQKEDPSNYEFTVPARLKELYLAKDYGRYAMADGNLPCCFITNNDITGGNSGSPVMNADGELIGLAFDGNWESMSSDIMFEPDLQRCICVDIRYVLFLIDKLGGAGYLLDEMNIIE